MRRVRLTRQETRALTKDFLVEHEFVLGSCRGNSGCTLHRVAQRIPSADEHADAAFALEFAVDVPAQTMITSGGCTAAKVMGSALKYVVETRAAWPD